MNRAVSNSRSVKKASTNRRTGRSVRAQPSRESELSAAPVDAAATNDPTLPFSGRRILLIDDNPGISTLLSGMLQDAGAAVDVTRSPDAAVAQAVRRPPALAVIHLPLPKDAAAQLTQRLRRHEALATLPVIVLSGEDRIDPDAAELADVVQPRPISPERLMDDVARLLQSAPEELPTFDG